MRLLENDTKAWLRELGLPVPAGAAVNSPGEAGRQTELLGGDTFLKALVAAGRRGKAGAVRPAKGREEAESVARELSGKEIEGSPIRQLYVETRIPIVRELYLSFSFGSFGPKAFASTSGGIDIEESFDRNPRDTAVLEIDPRLGFRPWEAVRLWEDAGLESKLLPELAALTVRTFEAFRRADALMLEINPLAIDDNGQPWLVGAMMEVDDNALFRNLQWADLAFTSAYSGIAKNDRERMVAAADRKFPGGAVRYTELSGNIGLMVAGGGAGLLQHDMIVAAGGAPANHTDISPTPTPEKPAAVFEAIFSNPRTRSLLIGYNFLQMAPCDLVIKGLLIAMERCHVDARRLPIVVRLFGPGEDEARALAASKPGIHYLPRGASLADGVSAIIAATQRVAQGGSAP